MVLALSGEIRQQFGSFQYTPHNAFFFNQSWYCTVLARISEQVLSLGTKEQLCHFETFAVMKLAALMLCSTQILPTPLNENDLNFQLFNRVSRKLHICSCSIFTLDQ